MITFQKESMSHTPHKRDEAVREVPRGLVSPMDFELLLRKGIA